MNSSSSLWASVGGEPFSCAFRAEEEAEDTDEEEVEEEAESIFFTKAEKRPPTPVSKSCSFCTSWVLG
jgi:hypothetical protein